MALFCHENIGGIDKMELKQPILKDWNSMVQMGWMALAPSCCMTGPQFYTLILVIVPYSPSFDFQRVLTYYGNICVMYDDFSDIWINVKNNKKISWGSWKYRYIDFPMFITE